MGERPSDDGRTGRWRPHPDDLDPFAGFEALLAAALRVEHVPDGEAEQRAVRAFRAARDAGAYRAARTRRRDDWRPRGRRGGRSLRTALSVLLAGCTLGGVAFAAIGGGADTAVRGADGTGRAAGSASADPARQGPGSGSAASVSPSASGESDRSDAAPGTEETCRAYERVKGHGEKLQSAAWKRLVTAAGGDKKVDGYCERTLRESGAAPRDSGTPEVPGDLPTAPATTPDVPSAPATRAPVDPTAALPTAPTAPDRDSVTDDVVNPGGVGGRPDTDTGGGTDTDTGAGVETGAGDAGDGGVEGE